MEFKTGSQLEAEGYVFASEYMQKFFRKYLEVGEIYYYNANELWYCEEHPDRDYNKKNGYFTKF